MALIAIGLHRYTKSKKPIVMWDSEGGSDFLMPLFQAANIPFLARKERTLKSLDEAIRQAVKVSDIMLIDSLTHAYQELIAGYKKSKTSGGFFIDLRDWGPIKDSWRAEFAHPYVNTHLHIIWAARSKNIFEDVLDEEATARAGGKEKFSTVSIGTGARAETESAYEPSLLCELEKVFVKRSRGKPKGQYIIRMTVNKDRTNEIMGNSFEYKPVKTSAAVKECKPFQDILPHFKIIQTGGGMDFQESSDAEMFDDEGNSQFYRDKRNKEIALDEIIEEIKRFYPGQDADSKKAKSDLIEEVFGSWSWKKVETMSLDAILAGRETIWLKLRGEPYTMSKPDTEDEVLTQIAES